jgi:hypothetical protein
MHPGPLSDPVRVLDRVGDPASIARCSSIDSIGYASDER